MPNGTLRVAYKVYYPFVSECARLPKLRISADCKMPGMAIEFIKIIVDKLGLHVEAADFSKIYSKSGFFDAFANNTFDFVAATFERSEELEKRFEFTAPIYYATTTLAVQHPSRLLDSTDFFTIYSAGVWVSLFLIFLAFCFVGCLIWKAERLLKMQDKMMAIGDLIWQLVRLQTMQYQKIEFKLRSGNLLLFVFALLQCGTLIKMYCNVITSSTIQKPNDRPFEINDLVRVLQERRFSFMFDWKEDWWYKEIQHSARSPFYELRQTLENNPVRFAHTDGHKNKKEGPRDLEPLELVNKNPQLITIFQNDMEDAFQVDDFCSLIYMESNFPVKPKHFILPKGHTLLPKINKIILEEYVYFMRIYNKYIGYRRSKCSQRDDTPKSLRLTSYYGQLYLFGIGTSIGIVIFVVEFFICRRNK